MFLHIGRQSRPELYDLHARKPESLVPRYLRREAEERVDYTGTVLVKLNIEELKKTVKELIDDGVESIAICFLHSYANHENERKGTGSNSRDSPRLSSVRIQRYFAGIPRV